MTMDKTTDPAMPRTLAEAQHALASIRPPQTATLADWLAYHRQSAAMYAEVAEIDRGHHHEALFLAEHARLQAKDIKARISSQQAIANKE
jgi:hypothetical protein